MLRWSSPCSALALACCPPSCLRSALVSKSLPSLLAKADSTIPWTGQTMCLFADRGFTPQPICIKAQGSQGTGTNPQNNTWKQPRLLSEVFQHRQRCLRPFLPELSVDFSSVLGQCSPSLLLQGLLLAPAGSLQGTVTHGALLSRENPNHGAAAVPPLIPPSWPDSPEGANRAAGSGFIEAQRSSRA